MIEISSNATDYFSEKLLAGKANALGEIYMALYFCGGNRDILHIVEKVTGFSTVFLENSQRCGIDVRFCPHEECDFLVRFPCRYLDQQRSLVLTGEIIILKAKDLKHDSNEDICKIIDELIYAFWLKFFKNPARNNAGPIPEKILYFKKNGIRWVPRWYVNVRAFLTQHEFNYDPFLTWLAAERWFLDQGFRFFE